MESVKNTAVIGAGASGIIAALFAAKKGNNILLFEKQNKTGRKILATGNGRCNISNKNLSAENYHSSNENKDRFLNTLFSRFGLKNTVDYFNSLGIPLFEEDDGRLFPESGQASSVVDMLNYELKAKKIDLYLNRMIKTIIPNDRRNSGFKVITAGREEYIVDSVILSAGSCAHPQLGGSAAGYELAASLGHTVNDPVPALVPLNIPLKILHTLQGIKWKCRVAAKINNRKVSEATGEVLFTKYGISGPAVLNLSREINRAVFLNNMPELVIDFYPGIGFDSLFSKISPLWEREEKAAAFSLAGILKKRMPEFIFQITGIDGMKKNRDLSSAEKRTIAGALKSFKLAPGKPRSFNEAMVAAGGIEISEINPETMESRIVKNLFITGELLDIDGDSGGYNLQFAWSTGAVAGTAQ